MLAVINLVITIPFLNSFLNKTREKSKRLLHKLFLIVILSSIFLLLFSTQRFIVLFQRKGKNKIAFNSFCGIISDPFFFLVHQILKYLRVSECFILLSFLKNFDPLILPNGLQDFEQEFTLIIKPLFPILEEVNSFVDFG